MTGFTVTDEAVEAAARAHWDAGLVRFPARIPWERLVVAFPVEADDARSLARLALEAAARTAQPTPPEPTDEEQQFIDMALLAVDSKSAGHWPTVAGYLADEVRRLRAILALVPQPTPVVDRDLMVETLTGLRIDGTTGSAVIEESEAEFIAENLAQAGVFKTEAEVRATAIEEVADAYLYDGDRDSQLPGYVALIECAAAIRAGGQHG